MRSQLEGAMQLLSMMAEQPEEECDVRSEERDLQKNEQNNPISLDGEGEGESAAFDQGEGEEEENGREEEIAALEAEYGEKIIELKYALEIAEASNVVKSQQLEGLEKKIQVMESSALSLKETLAEREKSIAELEAEQEKLRTSMNAQEQSNSTLEAENKRLADDLAKGKTVIDTLNHEVRSEKNKGEELQEALKKEKEKDRECVFSSTTEGIELTHLRQANKRLEKEVRQTRDFYIKQIEKERQAALDESGMNEFVHLLEDTIQSGKTPFISECKLCKKAHKDGQSDCKGFNCLCDVAKVVEEQRQRKNGFREELEKEMEFKYQSTIQKREIIILILSIILALRILY